MLRRETSAGGIRPFNLFLHLTGCSRYSLIKRPKWRLTSECHSSKYTANK
ncbi:hypothetical protein HMPREF0454_03527 [Hafnia alvei ATCC 51873]|uniref:Uncharacterized protein n=1 Tax=Hafnia alvei ATCC 51873 TaxID=1002364 RepID=G9YAA6_HAFAL|nr:hypothetical protein HMPREF0454_03527 [Hafnia alvei ATCC 51873]